MYEHAFPPLPEKYDQVAKKPVEVKVEKQSRVNDYDVQEDISLQ